jgi:hypothetical protein
MGITWRPVQPPQHQAKFRRKRFDMAKRGRKKRDRKYSKANHGKRPNA